METWIGCHRRAFEFFCGVPEEIVIDNLKAAVLKADLENPTLSVPYTRLARHYGFLVHPCRVRTPEHKSKMEDGVRYVQRSSVVGREFIDIEQANRKLLEWVINEAGVREHGTTREAPLKRFADIESSAMMEGSGRDGGDEHTKQGYRVRMVGQSASPGRQGHPSIVHRNGGFCEASLQGVTLDR